MKHIMFLYKQAVSLLLLMFPISLPGQPAGDRSAVNPVIDWGRIATEAAEANGLINLPIVESRIYAMTFLAVHDALNAIERRNHSYALKLRGRPNASIEAAVASAAHEVLIDQFSRLPGLFGISSEQAFFDNAYSRALTAIPDGGEKSAGIFIGRAAAAVILAIRAGDGWETQTYPDFNYAEGTKPGEYRFTEGNPFAFGSNWGQLQPFALRSGRQFRPEPPYRVRGHRYAEDVNEIKALGGDGTTTPSTRTDDETEIARFWYEDAPLQWNRIARSLASNQKLDPWRCAQLLAWLNVAQADGYIASFNAKYYYKFWRPETAIRLADTDENAETTADPNWTPLLPTPPVPDYDSAHSVEGAAAAQVFIHVFNKNDVPFSTCSTTLLPGQNCNDLGATYRSYASFTDAAYENGLSRILVGIHFRHAVLEGLAHGRKIGDWTVARILQPVRRDGKGLFDASAETPDTDR